METVIVAKGECPGVEKMDGVERVISDTKPFKLSGREFRELDTIVRVGETEIGGKALSIIAGPCAVESKQQTLGAAEAVKKGGATLLRGGAFKPRTSPYSFQGLGEEGLKILAEAREKTGLPIVTEVMEPRYAKLVAKYADMVQIGARNMQNFPLLFEVGKCGKPVLLKRGMSATIEDLLLAADYVMSQGNENVVLCERGIRTFETATRNTLDLSAVPVIQKLSHLPVIVDPSHATGKRSLITPMARAGIAAGADGIMVEVHPNPSQALCDGAQSLDSKGFAELMSNLRGVSEAVGRKLK